MGISIRTAKGVEIECDAVSAGSLYPVLHIHTKAITPADALAIFSDPEQTKTLTETTDYIGEKIDADGNREEIPMQRHRVYEGYTILQSIGRSPFIEGDILIWLNYDARHSVMEEDK